MKKTVTLLFFFIPAFMFGQMFSDDFESYTAGTWLGDSSDVWTTWGGSTGSAANGDVKISNEKAYSGANSIKFVQSGSNGGPADVVLPFWGKQEAGTFEMSFKLYVEEGTGAYWNYQGETELGKIWAIEFVFSEDGTYIVRSDGEVLMYGDFVYEEWMNVSIDVNLSQNDWDVTIGEDNAKFENNIYSIASMDIYPGCQLKNKSSFFIDDISMSSQEHITKDLDGCIFSINVGNMGLEDRSFPVKGAVRNLGNTAITSFDLTWTYGEDSFTKTISDVNIDYLESMPYEFTDLAHILGGENDFVLSVSNINGGADLDGSNDSKTKSIKGIVPALHKKVYIEEGTGTNCGWCPRGIVFMEYMDHEFKDYFVGVAVHSRQDPMQVDAYANGFDSWPGITGHPSAIFERNDEGDPSEVYAKMIRDIVTPPDATLTHNVIYNSENKTLEVTVNVEYLNDIDDQKKIFVALKENNVSGTGSDWAQYNSYAGGGSGPMGGFEKLKNPVPAKDMVYNLVARAILTPYLGDTTPSKVVFAGDIQSFTYTYQIPDYVKVKDLTVFSVLLNSDKTANNANENLITDYVDFTGVEDLNLANVNLYPNPALDYTNISLNITNPAEVTIEVVNILGEVVTKRAYGTISGNQVIPMYTSSFEAGNYFVKIQIGTASVKKKLVLIK